MTCLSFDRFTIWPYLRHTVKRKPTSNCPYISMSFFPGTFCGQVKTGHSKRYKGIRGKGNTWEIRVLCVFGVLPLEHRCPLPIPMYYLFFSDLLLCFFPVRRRVSDFTFFYTDCVTAIPTGCSLSLSLSLPSTLQLSASMSLVSSLLKNLNY